MEHITETGIRIRRAANLKDYEACLAIQKEVWGFTSLADYASVPLMRIEDRYGGSVLVAEDRSGDIQGFAYAILARDSDGSCFWWSHMTAVSPSLQQTGIGLQLKLGQREEALREGIAEIAWTFDPLQARNAHFNIRKLGVVVQDFEENLYGVSSSPLHAALPTDRLRARWDLASERVVDRIEGTASLVLRDFDGIVRVLDSQGGKPRTPGLDHGETPLLVEIPPTYPEHHDSARDWQERLRTTFVHYLGRGYSVTDFILVGGSTPQAFYVLER